MRAYWRAGTKRDGEDELQSGVFHLQHGDASGPWSRGWLETGPAPLVTGPTGGGPAAQEAVEAPPPPPTPFEQFAVDGATPPALAALVRCNRAPIGRSFACGATAPHVEAWCGSPLCPRCARGPLDSAKSWPERVLVVQVALPAPGGLPGPQAVIAVRTAWGQVAGYVEQKGGGALEKFPLVVTTPDGVTLFAPADGDPAGLVEAGLKKVRLAGAALVVDREGALRALDEALTGEARRLVASAPSTWAGLVAGRDPKRATVTASKALPFDAARRVKATPRPCPVHGAGCAVTGSVSGDRRGPALADQPTRQTLARWY